MNALGSTFIFTNDTTMMFAYSSDTLLPTAHATREKITPLLQQRELLSTPTNNQLNEFKAQEELLY